MPRRTDYNELFNLLMKGKTVTIPAENINISTLRSAWARFMATDIVKFTGKRSLEIKIITEDDQQLLQIQAHKVVKLKYKIMENPYE